jgi:hypothetical protein
MQFIISYFGEMNKDSVCFKKFIDSQISQTTKVKKCTKNITGKDFSVCERRFPFGSQKLGFKFSDFMVFFIRFLFIPKLILKQIFDSRLRKDDSIMFSLLLFSISIENQISF